jgi:hypothetical protein
MISLGFKDKAATLTLFFGANLAGKHLRTE